MALVLMETAAATVEEASLDAGFRMTRGACLSRRFRHGACGRRNGGAPGVV